MLTTKHLFPLAAAAFLSVNAVPSSAQELPASVCGTPSQPKTSPEVDCAHFLSPAQASLAMFETVGDSLFYKPMDGQGIFGPITPAADFIAKHFTSGRHDVVMNLDVGTDDYLAGVFALSHSKNFRLMGLMSSFGNLGCKITMNNTLRLLALAKADDVKVWQGACGPRDGAAPDDASGEHGKDGLGGATEPNPSEIQTKIANIPILENGAVDIIDDILDRYENNRDPLTYIQIGAATDLADILEAVEKKNPAALSKLRLSIMGGGVDTNYKHTNITPWAEFNFFQDPKAAQVIFEFISKHKIPTVLFPLDLTHTTSVRANYEGEWLARQSADNDVAYMIAQLYKAGGFDVQRSKDNGFSSPSRFQHDVNSVIGLVHPDQYQGVLATVSVIPDGEKAGQMILRNDPKGSVFVALKANSANIVHIMQATFTNFKGCGGSCTTSSATPLAPQ